jgi:hypothetical protein
MEVAALIEERATRDSYPGPEGWGNNLEHVSEITVRAVLPAARLRPCAACGGRFRRRGLFEVPEDHLTFFEGQQLCQERFLRHGSV